ncbi:MAG TPA: hypothetical protein VFD56_05905 [Chitinophagaceae bacterium]|nr:hypothetical protein [Chitinophagaceae bacterium]
MNKLTIALFMVLPAAFSMLFPNQIADIKLVGTKWISPVNDNCFESLCFTSEKTVMYFRCEQNVYLELGYKVVGNQIEIEAYGTSTFDTESKMVLVEDNGVLRQPLSQSNNFPKNFITVPGSECN